MEKPIDHREYPRPSIEKISSLDDLKKYHTQADSLNIIFGQLEKVYGNEDGKYPTPDFLEKYQDFSIWKTENRPQALEQKYQKYSLDELEKEQKYLLQLDTVIRKMAKDRWREEVVNGKKKRYFKGLKVEVENGKLEGIDISDKNISATFYASNKILENVTKPAIAMLSKLIRDKQQEGEKKGPKEEIEEDKKEAPKEKKKEEVEKTEKKEEKEQEKEPNNEKKIEGLAEKLKLLENTVKNFKDKESAILEKRYGRGVLGKFHRWMETTHYGKTAKIAAKILGGVAVASLATTTTGGVGLVLAPMLYAGGARYAIGGAIEGLQYLVGGWKRNRLMTMQSKTMDSLITEQKLLFNLEDKSQYAEHVHELTKRIKEQEQNVLKVLSSNIAKERRDKMIRAIASTVATGAFAWYTGLPLGWQDFDKNGLYHQVMARHDGFSFLYRSADNIDNIRQSLAIRDMGFWGIGHTLGHGLPTLGYVGLGTAATGIAIKLIRDVKQGYRDILDPGYSPSIVETVDFSRPIEKSKKADSADKPIKTKEKKTTEEIKPKVTVDSYESIYPELRDFVDEMAEKLKGNYKSGAEKRVAVEKVMSNLENDVHKKIKEFESNFKDKSKFKQNKEDFVDYKKNLKAAFDRFPNLNFNEFLNKLKSRNDLAKSFIDFGAENFAKYVNGKPIPSKINTKEEEENKLEVKEKKVEKREVLLKADIEELRKQKNLFNQKMAEYIASFSKNIIRKKNLGSNYLYNYLTREQQKEFADLKNDEKNMQNIVTRYRRQVAAYEDISFNQKSTRLKGGRTLESTLSNTPFFTDKKKHWLYYMSGSDFRIDKDKVAAEKIKYRIYLNPKSDVIAETFEQIMNELRSDKEMQKYNFQAKIPNLLNLGKFSDERIYNRLNRRDKMVMYFGEKGINEALRVVRRYVEANEDRFNQKTILFGQKFDTDNFIKIASEVNGVTRVDGKRIKYSSFNDLQSKILERVYNRIVTDIKDNKINLDPYPDLKKAVPKISKTYNNQYFLQEILNITQGEQFIADRLLATYPEIASKFNMDANNIAFVK